MFVGGATMAEHIDRLKDNAFASFGSQLGPTASHLATEVAHRP
jgi:hypothetical protein